MKTFSELFTESWKSFRGLLQPFLIGAVIVSAILLTSQLLLQKKALNVMGGNSPEHMAELSERIAQGDEAAMQEMLQGMGMDMNMMEELTEEEAGVAVTMHLLKNLAPTMGSFALVLILVTMIAKAYYLVVAVEEATDVGMAVKRTFAVIIPVIGLSLWMFLRSFAWIPIVGIVPGLIIGPRIAFAPIIYLREGKGILEATRSSYARTAGYWGRIFGYFLLFAFSMLLIALAVALAGKILSIIPVISLVALGIAHQLMMCFAYVFYARFGADILANPFIVASAPVRAAAPVAAVKKVSTTPPAKKPAPKKKPAAQKAKQVTKKKTVAKQKKK